MIVRDQLVKLDESFTQIVVGNRIVIKLNGTTTVRKEATR